MKIKKGDNIVIISGKDKGKKGKVVLSLPRLNKIIVEGVNQKKRHQKPKKGGQKGQVILKPAPIAVSSAMLVCARCNRPVRIGYKIMADKKVRVCKKCGAEI